jgi:glycosyltransferase involved in cell wall biosynthesis
VTTLSALIMASREELMLPGCLSLLAWADEIVVLVDDRSDDRTAEIAAELGARVSIEPWHGFARQRDRLAELSTGDWLLFVDADERVTADLAGEIREVVEHGFQDAYSVPTRNVFLGRPMRAGGWWPDPHVRLIRRASLVRWQGLIHEVPLVQGSPGELKNAIVHLGHRDLTSMLVKTATWSRLEGERRAGGPYPPVRLRTLLRAIQRDILRRLIRKAGWRDGVEGWIEVLYQAFSSFLSVAQAGEIQRKEPLAETYRRLDAHLQAGGSADNFPAKP